MYTLRIMVLSVTGFGLLLMLMAQMSNSQALLQRDRIKDFLIDVSAWNSTSEKAPARVTWTAQRDGKTYHCRLILGDVGMLKCGGYAETELDQPFMNEFLDRSVVSFLHYLHDFTDIATSGKKDHMARR